MTDLLEHHINETREKFSDIKEDLRSIQNKLDDIAVFKLQSIATTRTISLLVSSVAGFLTLTATLFIAWYSKP